MAQAMTITVSEHLRSALPPSIRRKAGIKVGSELSVKVTGRVITLAPAEDEYTPEQRAAISARLEEGRKGPFYGPFKNGDEVAAFLKSPEVAKITGKARKPGR